jgi:hypothetical protein
MRFAQKQIEEIASDPVLRCYGAALALVNSVTALYWLTVYPIREVLNPGLPPVCWPFANGCQAIRILSPAIVTALVLILLVAAVSDALLFITEGLEAAGYWLLLGLSILKATLLIQDYRLILNQHYMAYWTVLPFLFIGDKRRLLQYLIVLFYFWAGTLKLNPEWISGSALYGRHPLGLPQALIPAACVYVIVLELAIVFGLFAKRGWIFWLAFAQLLLFHLASFWAVGFFYPLLMYLLLAIFPLSRHWSPPVSTPDLRSPVGFGALVSGTERFTTYAVLTTFCLLQLVPLAFSGDPAITGEGRLFALHMFDAPVECRATATFRLVGGDKREVELRAPFLTARIECDPIVYYNLAKDYCYESEETFRSSDFDLVLKSRRQGRGPFQTIVSVPSFCAVNPSYTMWRHNWWIRPTG